MEDDLFRGFDRFANLEHDERRAISAAVRIRRLRAKEEVSVEGEPPKDIHVLLSGWACEYKMLPDGRRQIVTLLLPGDAWNLHMADIERSDCSVCGLTATVIARFPQWKMEQIMREFPQVQRMSLRNLGFSSAMQREMTVSLGRRDGLERVAHFLCETMFRLQSVGLAGADSCPFPLTQADLGDALGFTAVHANRLLQELRLAGHIVLRGRVLTITDRAVLRDIAKFSPQYLQMAYVRPQVAPAGLSAVAA